MSTHNMFSWRNKKNINTFGLKKASYLKLCKFILLPFRVSKLLNEGQTMFPVGT